MDEIEVEKRLTTVEQQVEHHSERMDAIEKRQDTMDDLVGTVKVLATRQESVETDVKEIKDDVKILAGKSGKRWDGIIDKTITVVSTAVVTYFLAKFGM